MIVIVGAGPAGMMAAIRAAELRANVTLIEKNPILGRKLLLSGKGRCNLTNACGLELFLQRFSKNGPFLRDAFKKFFNTELINFFQSKGLKLKIERQQRVFPVTDKSTSILEVLKKELQKNKVTVLCNISLKDIFTQNNKIKSVLFSDGRTVFADKLILATGGLSYKFTGSTGEGQELAKKLGHQIVAGKPGLVPLETRERYPKILEGLTLKNIRLKFSNTQTQIISEIGELLFTGFGISGPLVLSLSGKIVDWLAEKNPVFVEIDLKPALSTEQLNARLLRELKLNAKKNIKNALKSLMPLKLVDIFIEIAKIDPHKQASHLTQEERKIIISLLKALRLNIVRSLPLEEAMITRGGVSLKEINPRTMESRLIKGLYFAGEIIDIDADTGGFNLQAAFSTGYLAGESASL